MNRQKTAGLQQKMSKDDINALPLIGYDGPIHLIDNAADVSDAVTILSKDTLLGFDTETRPSFRKGESYLPSLLQLAGTDSVYLFQLKRTGLPSDLSGLLANPAIIKAGVAIVRDIKELQDIEPFDPQGFVDLGDKARDLGLNHHGLRGLAALLLDGRISKGARLTNWARADLPEQALRYAATDAWVGRRIYQAMD